jgi:hypothetical protein
VLVVHIMKRLQGERLVNEGVHARGQTLDPININKTLQK